MQVLRSFSPGIEHRSEADRFAGVLQLFYSGLLEQGVPEHLANLVRRLNGELPDVGRDGRPLALVVEADEKSRSLAGMLLEETGLGVIECASAEAALTVLQSRGAEVAFIFADEDLAGPRDGYSLARTAGTLWPNTRTVLTTSGAADRPEGLPDSVVVLAKPWRGLDVLIEAERALQEAAPSLA